MAARLSGWNEWNWLPVHKLKVQHQDYSHNRIIEYSFDVCRRFQTMVC